MIWAYYTAAGIYCITTFVWVLSSRSRLQEHDLRDRGSPEESLHLYRNLLHAGRCWAMFPVWPIGITYIVGSLLLSIVKDVQTAHKELNR